MNAAAVLLVLGASACTGAQPERAAVSADELREQCTAFEAAPQSEAARACVAYVRGFIDGLTAGRTDRDDAAASWTERAARTRLGPGYQSRLMTRTECLDDPRAMDELVRRVLAQLSDASAAEESDARELVLRIVREQSPCKA